MVPREVHHGPLDLQVPESMVPSRKMSEREGTWTGGWNQRAPSTTCLAAALNSARSAV
jgi:hypothetical protein